VVKYKTHNMGNVSALAYNLTQLVSGLELVQRLGANISTVASIGVDTPRIANTINNPVTDNTTPQTPTKHTNAAVGTVQSSAVP
jgi:hypothetical protein